MTLHDVPSDSVLVDNHDAYVQTASESCRKEVEGLQKKLRWYAENQQLLDRDAALLKQKDAEILQLADKLHQLTTEVSSII